MGMRTTDLPESVQQYIAQQDAIAAKGKAKGMRRDIAAQCEVAKKAKRAPAHVDGVPNSLEAAYNALLRRQMLAGVVTAFWFEAVKVRLTERRWWLADFLIQFADGHFELHDTKGWMREDAALKAEFTAETYPWPVVIVTRTSGGWEYKLMPRRPKP